MDRVSDEALDLMIDWNERIQAYQVVDALTELRERRAAEKDYRKALDAANMEFLRGYADVNAGNSD